MTVPADLVQFCIYHNPSDFPGCFVVRRYYTVDDKVLRDAQPVAVVKTLEEARKVVPENYDFQFAKSPYDDKAILEVWLTMRMGRLLRMFGIVPKYCAENK